MGTDSRASVLNSVRFIYDSALSGRSLSVSKIEPGDQMHFLGETHHFHTEPLARPTVDMEDSPETISNFQGSQSESGCTVVARHADDGFARRCRAKSRRSGCGLETSARGTGWRGCGGPRHDIVLQGEPCNHEGYYHNVEERSSEARARTVTSRGGK
mgnify:CR=1 FL=1